MPVGNTATTTGTGHASPDSAAGSAEQTGLVSAVPTCAILLNNP